LTHTVYADTQVTIRIINKSRVVCRESESLCKYHAGCQQ